MANLYRIGTVWSGLQGSPWYSTLYFDAISSTADQAADAVSTFWGAIDVRISGAVSWTLDSDVPIIDDATGNTVALEQVGAASGTGGSGLEPMPPANQVLLRWRTGAFVSGRELRGRTYIPGVTEDQNDSGNVIESYRTLVETAAVALVGDASAELVVYSPTHGTSQSVVSGTVWNQWAVMRSRRD